MSQFRDKLPQLDGGLFITDGGLETDLIFHQGAQLPCNAAYTLLETEEGAAQLSRYFADYVDIARNHGLGLVLESATWRANPDWAAIIGTAPDRLAQLNRRAIDMLVKLRALQAEDEGPLVISGCLGPRSDAYRPTDIMTPEEAERYHAGQIETFADTEADMASAMTLTNIPEAIGVARAARRAGMPVAISFTVETDGRLPTGPRLQKAIEQVDDATDAFPRYYMINCAHPTHFDSVLQPGESWTARIRALRANSSVKSHAELDESTELDEGNPAELAGQYRELVTRLPHFNVLGGCCGTDARHVREIAAACAKL